MPTVAEIRARYAAGKASTPVSEPPASASASVEHHANQPIGEHPSLRIANPDPDAALFARIADLEAKLATAEAANAELQATITQLQADQRAYDARIAKDAADYNALIDELEEEKVKNAQLKADNAQLWTDNVRFLADNKQLWNDNAQLQATIAQEIAYKIQYWNMLVVSAPAFELRRSVAAARTIQHWIRRRRECKVIQHHWLWSLVQSPSTSPKEIRNYLEWIADPNDLACETVMAMRDFIALFEDAAAAAPAPAAASTAVPTAEHTAPESAAPESAAAPAAEASARIDPKSPPGIAGRVAEVLAKRSADRNGCIKNAEKVTAGALFGTGGPDKTWMLRLIQADEATMAEMIASIDRPFQLQIMGAGGALDKFLTHYSKHIPARVIQKTVQKRQERANELRAQQAAAATAAKLAELLEHVRAHELRVVAVQCALRQRLSRKRVARRKQIRAEQAAAAARVKVFKHKAADA